MERKSVVTLTSLYFPGWNKSLATSKITLPLIKHEARVLETCIDPSSCSTNENEYGIFNPAKMSCKYLYLLDHYNVVNLNINDYKGQITEYLDSLWAVSTPNRFPQILSSHLDRSRKSDDFVINEGLTNEELSLRKNVLYDHTI